MSKTKYSCCIAETPVMAAVNRKVRSLLKTYGFDHGMEKIHNDLLEYLLSLKEESLMEVISKRHSIFKSNEVLPTWMTAYIFTKSPSEMVCRLIVDDSVIDDYTSQSSAGTSILQKYLQEEPATWKIELANKWIKDCDDVGVDSLSEDDLSDDE